MNKFNEGSQNLYEASSKILLKKIKHVLNKRETYKNLGLEKIMKIKSFPSEQKKTLLNPVKNSTKGPSNEKDMKNKNLKIVKRLFHGNNRRQLAIPHILKSSTK